MTDQDITDAWEKMADLPRGWSLAEDGTKLRRSYDGATIAAPHEPRLVNQMIKDYEFCGDPLRRFSNLPPMRTGEGAVGSSEPPPDPWRGISGPPGPLSPYFGTAGIEWSGDPAAWAKPGTPVMQKLIDEIDQWCAVVRDRDAKISTDEREILVLRAERDAWKYLYETVKPDPDARMLKADETGNHDYVGPVKDGKAVPDPTHERFHGSVGDVIAGNVMRPARDQMERALADAKVKDGKAPPPFPSAHAVPDHRRIGS